MVWEQEWTGIRSLDYQKGSDTAQCRPGRIIGRQSPTKGDSVKTFHFDRLRSRSCLIYTGFDSEGNSTASLYFILSHSSYICGLCINTQGGCHRFRPPYPDLFLYWYRHI